MPRAQQRRRQKGKGGIGLFGVIPGLRPWSVPRWKRRWNLKHRLPPAVVSGVRNTQVSTYLKKLGLRPPKKL